MTNTKLHIIKYGLVCAIGLMPLFSSCSDSDDHSSKGTQEEMELQDIRQVDAISNVLEVLADVKTLDKDFYNKTYTPTYGKVLDESNPYVRAMKSEDKEEAYAVFAAMIGDSELLKSTTDGYTVELKLSGDLAKLAGKETFGTLTYHQGDGSTRMAYVDVNIPNMPTLQRIDFVPSQLWGDNDGVKTAYTLGQLVKYDGTDEKNSKGEGLWLCVQEYKGDNKGLLVHLNEGYNENFARHLYGDSGYSWSSYWYADPEDYAPYFQLLNRRADIIKKIRNYLVKNNKASLMSGIVPKRFLENDSVYVGDRPAWVINNSYESSYDWWAARYWKCCKHYYLDKKNEHGYGQFHKWWYHTTGDWKDQQSKYYFYTISVMSFKKDKLAGISLVYDPAPNPKKQNGK